MLTTRIGRRPGAQRPVGRVLVPRLARPVKVLIPDRGAMANLWLTCREIRKRPVTLVTLMVGAYVLAADAAGGRHPRGWSVVPGSGADLRRFVGARKNAAWTQRLRDLEGLELLHVRDGQRMIAPVRSWYRSERALTEARKVVPLRPLIDPDEIPF